MNERELVHPYHTKFHPSFGYARAFLSVGSQPGEATEPEEMVIELYQVVLDQARREYVVLYVEKNPVGDFPSTELKPITLGRSV